ncbi:MAG: hypothetical protein JSS34_02740 [Proteobacteria bacterium]|nr:hypothetical protein [Pseudomonadota bacterium]
MEGSSPREDQPQRPLTSHARNSLTPHAKEVLRKAQTAQVKDLTDLFPSAYRNAGLRQTISSIPNIDRNWVLTAALQRCQSLSPEEIVNVIKVLPSIPKAERKRFLEITDSFEGTEPSILLPLLEKIETSELHHLLRDIKPHDNSGKWLLTALPLGKMQFFPRAKRPHMFERVRGITEALLSQRGCIAECDRFSLDEISKLHDMTDENYENLRDLLGRVLENKHGLLHKLLQFPEDDFRNLSDFILRIKGIFQVQYPIDFFFPLINVRPSEREMCFDTWCQVMNLSNIPTHPDQFRAKLMEWPVTEGYRFISMYQSFLTSTMTHHDRRVLLDQFLDPERYCRTSPKSLFPPYFMQDIKKAFERDVSKGLEERHRFTRLVELIENHQSSLEKFFEQERLKEKILREQQALAQRMEKQRERQEQARRELERLIEFERQRLEELERQRRAAESAQRAREEAERQRREAEAAQTREERARQRLLQEQRALQQLEREQAALNERAAAIPAFKSWVMGQEAMMRERDEVTRAVLAVWTKAELLQYRPREDHINFVFKEKFCDPIKSIVKMRMNRIISDKISAPHKQMYHCIINSALACRDKFIQRDTRFYSDTLFYYDADFPALHQFFWGLRTANDIITQDETWILELLETAYNKNPQNFENSKTPEGFSVKGDQQKPTTPVPFKEWIRVYRSKIVPCLREMKSIMLDKEYFRLQTALQGLGRVEQIRGDYAYDTGKPGVFVPKLREFCGFLGNLSFATLTPEGFAQGWMTEHWKDPSLRRVFPELQGSDTFGEALGLNPALSDQMVSVLTSALRDHTTIPPHSLPVISKVTKAYFKALFDPFDAIVDALFMAMRGHTGQGYAEDVGRGQMTNPLWPHQQACADGVAVGLFRTTTENALTQVIASSLIGITVVKCHVPV